MLTEATLVTDRCLMLFDLHEDVGWLRRVLAAEEGNYTHLLLGGDYFDCMRTPVGGGVSEMCGALMELRERLGDRLTVLMGNHDVAYADATGKGVREQPLKYGRLLHPCSGYSVSKAMRILRGLDPAFWAECRLFQMVNGWLVSHAGVAPCFWGAHAEVPAGVAALEKQCARAWRELCEQPAPILAAGVARGGGERRGGVTWQDFDDEFEDALPLPQVVGHTLGAGAREKGRSWCLEGGRTCYGVLEGGRLRVGYAG